MERLVTAVTSAGARGRGGAAPASSAATSWAAERLYALARASAESGAREARGTALGTAAADGQDPADRREALPPHQAARAGPVVCLSVIAL